MSFVSSRLPWLLVVAPLALLTGCQSTQVRYSPSAANSGPLGGHVMGGEQPITAATIQIYAVGATTDGGVATPLLSATVTTSDGTGQSNANANAGNDDNQLPAGYFTVAPADFDCPSGTSLLYIAAIGGNPGNGANNAQENIDGLGPCNSLPPVVVINEVTTVGTVAPLHNYMTAYNAVGSTPAHAAALAAAFSAINEYVNVADGAAPGPALPNGYYASDPDLRALANAVQYCVNSTGSTVNGTPCGTFFADAQGTAANPPTDTVGALLDIFADPTNNVTTLFNLQGTSPAFSPTNAMAPPDWTLPILEIPTAPAISPAPGTYAAAQSVTLADADTDSSDDLYYTTDGSTPSATNGTLYSGPITVSSSTAETISAVAIDDSRLSSSAASAAYTINTSLTAPTVSLASLSVPYASTTGITLTATSNANGSVVTFGTAGSIGGSFSPVTCTISGTTCSVTYTPSGTLAVGVYTNDLTASFAATGTYGAGYATGTLTVAGSSTVTLLHSFTGAADGRYPYYGSLAQGSDGSFYGATDAGGAHTDGTVYKVTPNGSTFTLLHSFAGPTADGNHAFGGVVQGANGNFYGTTHVGGANSLGSVFEISSDGSTFNLLHSFAGTADGENPAASLVPGIDGNFYGTTVTGGENSKGAIFKISPDGSTFSLLYSFSSASTADGQQPYAPLVQGADGNFYGVTSAGGANNLGTIFKITPDGVTFTLLHSFSGSSDGQLPESALVQGADGYFYGTTYSGGSSGDGTVFKVAPDGSNFTVLHVFAGGTTDGANCDAGLVLGSDGNFYGVAAAGGANGDGTIFEINSTGSNYSVLHSFAGSADGKVPGASLTQGADGSLYGTGDDGGTDNIGTVFSVSFSPALAPPVALTAPASVTAGASFTLSYSVSNAYSATLQTCFATNNAGDITGWVGAQTGSPTTASVTLTAPAATGTYTYALTCGGVESGFTTLTVTADTAAETPDFSPGTGTYTGAQTVYIYSDSGTSLYYTTDGNTPVVGNGDTTLYTGPIAVSASETVEAIATGGGYTTSAVGSAAYVIQTAPTVSLASISAPNGSTTGVTLTATSNAAGSVVTFGTAGSIGGSFSNSGACTISGTTCSVNYIPSGTLAAGMYANDLTASFSAYGSYAAASAASTLTVAVAYTETLLHSFAGATTDGSNPFFGNLIQGSNGNFYGMTDSGGADNAGTIFELTPNGTDSLMILLYNFTGGNDGVNPQGSLVQGADGNFYGMTSTGGADGYGTVFELTPNGSSSTFTLLYTFTGGNDGGVPEGSLVRGADGNFYGMTSTDGADNDGTVFELTPNGTGSTFTLLYTFTGGADGAFPNGSLVQGSDGNFYGMTYAGGAHSDGTVFELTPNGSSSTLTLLHAFTGGADGGNPYGSLVQGSDGNFYGTTGADGTDNVGTVFELTPNGTSSTFTLLHTFTGAADGAFPNSSLAQGSDGNFYGMTSAGGADGGGTAFELTPNGTSSTFTLLHAFAGGADGESPGGSLVQGADGNFYGMANGGGADNDGAVFEVAVSPALAAPITLSAPSTVAVGNPFTLTYAVSNVHVASPNHGTLEQCFAGAYNHSSAAYTALGAFTGSPTSQNTTLTAPSAGGTYTLGVTCGGQESSTTSLTVTGSSAAAMPAFSPVAGTYSAAQSVTISTTSTGASLYYTTDGNTPVVGNGDTTLYTGPIAVSVSETLNAIASGGGFSTSAVGTAAYVIQTAPTVSISSVSTNYGSTTGVTITATGTDEGATVTFGVTSPADGTFSPATCTIAGGSCSVFYIPSGTLGAGSYTNDLTASFAAYGSYTAASATSTLTVPANTTLASFTGPNGANSYGNLIQGVDGNFYGTTSAGGANGDGTVFEVVPKGASSTLTTLYSFGSTSTDGQTPEAGLVQGADGNLYGTTLQGGVNGEGTVFELVPNGASSTLTTLHSFGSTSTDGQNPYAGLVQGADGNFYGTTSVGGVNGDGTVFEIVPNDASSILTTLYSFGSTSTDGQFPYAGLVQGADGNFYGATTQGGVQGYGSVFELVPNGASSTLITLYSFGSTSTDGSSPYGGLVQGTDGNFYGTTQSGGATGNGTIFELVPNGVNSTLTILYSFGSTSTDGASPFGGLVQGSDGNFYGATFAGGATGNGTVFKLVPNGVSSTLTILYSFGSTSTDGANPYGGLVQGADGNFYGTTEFDYTNNAGTVFELAVSPALAAPVTFSAPSSANAGEKFYLTYAVANAYATSPYSGTLEQCFAGVHDSSGNYTRLGTFIGSPILQNTTITAPSTAGTYTFGVTCGGQESSTATLTVQ